MRLVCIIREVGGQRSEVGGRRAEIQVRVSITCEGGIIQGNKIENLKKMLLFSTEVPILIPNVPMAQAP